jgi:ATP-binding cassette subfamily B protein
MMINRRDVARLNWLALGMITIPIVNGIIGVWQRQLNASIGEGVIYDLRRELYSRLQRMSMRFFTQTRTGELMSRLNNDVIGAQRAISNTMVTIISNIVTLVATLSIMVALEWRLTLLGLVILPFFILPARKVGKVLRDLRRKMKLSMSAAHCWSNFLDAKNTNLIVFNITRVKLEISVSDPQSLVTGFLCCLVWSVR